MKVLPDEHAEGDLVGRPCRNCDGPLRYAYRMDPTHQVWAVACLRCRWTWWTYERKGVAA